MTSLYITREDFFGEDLRINNKPIRYITRYYYINNDYGKCPEIAIFDSDVGILALNEAYIHPNESLSIYRRALVAPLYSNAYTMLLNISRIGPDCRLLTYTAK